MSRPTGAPGTTPRRAPFLLLQVAELLGGLANSMVMVIIPWLVLDQTGSAADAGLVGAVATIPGIVVAPFVGVMVDRVGRRRVSIMADAASAVSVALFPILAARGHLDLATIVLLTLLGAVFDPAGYTARKALIPDVAHAGHYYIDRINGVHEGVFSAGWVLGPALGAAGIAALGPTGTLWVTSVAFLLSVVAVALIQVVEGSGSAHLGAEPEHHPATERFTESLRRGLGALWSDPTLRALTIMVAVLSAVYMPTEAVLMPVHFNELGQPGAYGAVIMSMSVGGMIGSFLYGWLAARFSRHQICMAALLGVAAAMVPMAVLPGPVLFSAAGFALGLSWGPMNPLMNSVVQARVPAHLHGRIYGVQMSLFYAAPPLGILLAGVAVERFGVQAVYAALAGLLALMCVGAALAPALRGLDSSAAQPAKP